MLEVLDLGNNHITDKFPCWLKNVSNLRVLILRSNKFYERISCLEIDGTLSMLQIIDLSSNNFWGRLPRKALKNWKPMSVDYEDTAQSELEHLQNLGVLDYEDIEYKDAITLANKGLEMELLKIITLFTSIDFSWNHFQGPIPEEIGLLKSLHVLNLSHNALTGQIPSSIGNLQELESFDLSFNNLTGAIPSELASLHFLSVLNLSYNHLVGRIPSGTQLQLFSPASFEGNGGLCGLPLADNCTTTSDAGNEGFYTSPGSSKEIDWRFFLMAIGFAIAFGATVTPLMFSKKVNKWYDNFINKFKMNYVW